MTVGHPLVVIGSRPAGAEFIVQPFQAALRKMFRLRHLPTVAAPTPRRAATAVDAPTAHASTICAGWTKLLGSDRDRLIRVSSASASSLSSTGATGRPRGIGAPPARCTHYASNLRDPTLVYRPVWAFTWAVRPLIGRLPDQLCLLCPLFGASGAFSSPLRFVPRSAGGFLFRPVLALRAGP